MSSFYGGKQGRTYHIVQRYDSVAQMVSAFSGGGAYSDVNYGQYVIIDTILNNHNKTSPQNGLLYRRGFDYNDNPDFYPQPHKDDTNENEEYIYYDGQGNLKEEQWNNAWDNWKEHPGAGAIYVGQIVGPQGQSPEIILESWEVLNQIQEREINTVIPVSNTAGDNQNPVYDGEGQPRKYEDDEPIWYGDLIKVASCTVKDEYGNISGAQLAFDIPHLVLKTQVVNTNPYLISTVTENPASTAHPFYYKWDFEIPGGKHGQDLTQIVKEQGSAINNSTIDGEGNPIVDEDEYLTYTITNYDNGQPGDTDAAAAASTAHLGRWPYRVINEIEPVLKIREILNLEKWEQKYEDNQRTVDIGTLYREGDYPKDIYWICVKSGDITNPNDKPKKENATMANLDFQDTSIGNGMIWRVINIPETTTAHSLNVDYKAGPNDLISGLRNIDYITVNKNDGKMYVVYADSDIPYYLTTVNSIEYIRLDQDINSRDYGKIKIKYFKDTEDSVLYDPNILEQIKFENQDDITKDQYFSAKYKRYVNPEVNISEPFNRILAVDRYGDNLICLYSDPGVRAASTVGKVENRDYYKLDWTDPITKENYRNLVWKNFGSIGAQYHIQGNYTYEQLNSTYVAGFGIIGEENRAGWIATVTTYEEEEGQQKPVIKLYAFDYNDNSPDGIHIIPDGQGGTTFSHWYEVMSVSEEVVANPNYSILVSEIDKTKENPTPEEDASKLREDGLWFVVSYGHDQEVINNG